jgi:para-aminobenzoate synthetase
MDVLHQCPTTPVLGVCLGQQAMAVAAGGHVVRAPEPVHGRLSTLLHNGHELFAGCPSGPGSGFDVVRCVGWQQS